MIVAKIFFETPNGKECHGCMALDDYLFYCKFFKEFLKNEHGCAGYLKCDACKELKKYDYVM